MQASSPTPTYSKPLLSASALSKWLLCLYGVSGFCALTLETIWMRAISLRAGNTVVASTLVIVVFFAAAALGNLWGAHRVGSSARPLLFYGRFETTSGLAAALAFGAGQWMWAHLGILPSGLSGQIPATLLMVGPPSFFAGVAFPSLAETFVPSAERRTAGAGPFYGANLLGAAFGVTAGSVLLPWWMGLNAAFATAAFLQISCGVVAWRLALHSAPRPLQDASPRALSAKSNAANARPLPSWLGWGVLAASGLLSLATQSLLIVWARQILQGSVYAVCGVLCAFIGGLGLGALAAAFLRKIGRSASSLLSLFAGLSAGLLFLVPTAGQWLVQRQIDFASPEPVQMLGQALGWSVLWLLPLTFCLGGVFPVAWELAKSSIPHEGRVLGTALALNKMGSAMGSVAGLFLLLPILGLVHGTHAIAWGYLLLVGAVMCFTKPRRYYSLIFLLILAGFGIWQTAQLSKPLGMNPDYRFLAEYSGAYGPVSVIEKQSTGSRMILLNSRQFLSGTRRALSSQRHQSWAPLLFCRNPERVATIGMAAGISADAALDFPLKELYAVELIPEIARAAREHFVEWNARLFSDTRVKIMIGDGRIVLAQIPGKLDVIICDLFFPSEDGTANLYSREFFQYARSRLNRNGVFCLWLPCYQHDPQIAGTIIRTFLDVFPNAMAVRANMDPTQPVIGLLGSDAPIPLSREFLAERLQSVAGRAIALESPFFRSPENARLLIAGDLRSADPGFGSFPKTTDDKPLMAFLGPRVPHGRLIGVPFLDWIGKRFLNPSYPSCDIGSEPPQVFLSSIRAGNFYFAAAVFNSVIPGDKRPEDVRLRQTMNALNKARTLCPGANLPEDTLGQ